MFIVSNSWCLYNGIVIDSLVAQQQSKATLTANMLTMTMLTYRLTGIMFTVATISADQQLRQQLSTAEVVENVLVFQF